MDRKLDDIIKRKNKIEPDVKEYDKLMTGVVHRDLKLENILVEDDSKNDDLCLIKLIDFGTSKIFHR